MEHLDILGRAMPVEFLVDGQPGTLPDDAADGLRAMALLIDTVDWPALYKAAYDGMKKLVVFEGVVRVNTHPMDRSCCDEDDAVFYWKLAEFRQNAQADVRANTFFHDCWHVVQFKRTGRFAQGRAEQVAREIDAIDHQIEVAKLLGCDLHEIGHLENFRADQELIEARLDEGVQRRMFHGGEVPRALA